MIQAWAMPDDEDRETQEQRTTPSISWQAFQSSFLQRTSLPWSVSRRRYWLPVGLQVLRQMPSAAELTQQHGPVASDLDPGDRRMVCGEA